MSCKLDSVEVIDFAFVYVCNVPHVTNGRQNGILPVGRRGLEPCGGVGDGVLEFINHTKASLFAPVHAYEIRQIVVASLFEGFHFCAQHCRLQCFDVI